MKQTDLSYAAGLMDGEGSVCLTRAHANEHRSPWVAVPSCTRDIVVYLKETFGGMITNKSAAKPQHSHSWVWSLKRQSALEFLSLVVPYMREPTKVARANLLIAQYNKVTIRNGRYNIEQAKAKLAFEEVFFSL